MEEAAVSVHYSQFHDPGIQYERPKLQLLSGHTTEQSLAVYRELALSDVAEEYERAMQRFPIR